MPIKPVTGRIEAQEINDNLSYLDSLVKSVNAAPKGAYASLTELQAAYPNGNSNVYVVSADGGWYFWNGSIWTLGGAYQSTTLSDRMVSPNKTSFVEYGKNLFDISTITKDTIINKDTGVLSASPSYNTSDFIPVSPNTAYTAKSMRFATYYDSAKQPISGVGIDVANVAPYTFTTPTNAKFIRFSFAKSSVVNMQLEQGSTQTAFEPYSLKFNNLKVSPKVSDISGYIANKNLFNKNKASLGYYVNNTTGNIDVNASYAASEFIEIEPGAKYTQNYAYYMAIYDMDKTYISGLGVGALATASRVLTMPNNAKYIRVSIPTAYLDVFQVEKGDKETSFNPYQKTVEGLAIAKESLEFEVNLPSKIFAINGMETNIFFDALSYKPTTKDFDVECSKGQQLDKKYSHIPSVSETVDLNISTSINGSAVGFKKSSIISKASSEIANNYKGIFIGDSTTNAGEYTQRLLDLFTSDTYSDLTLVGTRGTGANLHEGRSGWTAQLYTTVASSGGVTNPFWNANSSQFDFGNYMAQNGYSGLTHAFIHLGINDIFNFKNDETLKAGVPTILSQFDTIISSIRAYDPNIKIGLMLTIPPNASQAAFGAAYGCGQTQWRYNRNYIYFVSELIKKYDNRNSENIYLVPTNVCIDPTTDINDAVHPNTGGYGKMGEQVYKFLKVVG